MARAKKAEEPQPRRGRRSRTVEENMKALAFKWLEQRAVSDPVLQDMIIAHEFGIDIKKIDRLANVKQELEIDLVEMAIEEIRKNEDLRRIFVRAKAFEIMNMKDPELEPKPPPQPRPDPVDEAIKNYEKMEQLKEIMGVGKRSFWDGLADAIGGPVGFAAILNMITTFIAKQQGNPVQECNNQLNVNIGTQFQEALKPVLEAIHPTETIPPVPIPTSQSPLPVETAKGDAVKPTGGNIG